MNKRFFLVTAVILGAGFLYKQSVQSMVGRAAHPDDKNATHVVINDHQITEIPSHILSEYPNLTTISIYNNSLTGISPTAFAGRTRLTELLLPDNGLRSFPENLFSGLSNLERLDLSG